jgi:hypothetical protein
MSLKMFKNKVFQAALAIKAKNEQKEQQQRSKLASSLTKNLATRSEVTKIDETGSALTQRTKVPPSPTEARATQSAAPISRPQNDATRDGHRPLATFSSASYGNFSSDSVGKRKREDLISSPQEQSMEYKRRVDSCGDTPVTDRKPQPAVPVQQSHVHMQSVKDAVSNRLLPASPHASVLTYKSATSATQNRSPPTPPRHFPSRSVLHNLPSGTQQYQQSPLSRKETPLVSSMFLARPATLYGSNHKNSSPPPPNEPTPFCPAASTQHAYMHQIGAGFYNDGNTCYLR